MSEPKDGGPDPDWAPQGPQLSADGVVEGTAPKADVPPSPIAPRPEEAPLELVERPKPPEALLDENLAHTQKHFDGPARRPRTAAKVVMGLLLLSALVVGTLPLWLPRVRAVLGEEPRIHGIVSSGEPASKVDKVLNAVLPDRASLLIDSTPDGAEVRINGELVGTTPFAGTNRFGSAPKVRISKAGYRTWTGTVTKDGDFWKVNARLE